MSARTYLPALQFIARRLCGYIRKYERQIRGNLDTSGEAALDAVLVACEALEAAIIIAEGV